MTWRRKLQRARWLSSFVGISSITPNGRPQRLCASTADFMYDFTNALPANTNGLAFAVYICEYTNFKFKKLNKNPISTHIYGDYMATNEFCDFLFNNCGTSGWDIVHTGFSFKLVHRHMKFVYAIYVRERQ